MSAEEINWNKRYCWNYSERVKAASRLWNIVGRGLCVCCMVSPAQEIHHTSYGSDSLGINWFPVCVKCHKQQCHSSENWIKDKDDPLWSNRNTEDFVEMMQRNYRSLSSSIFTE